LTAILDLGIQPLADTFIAEDDLSKADPAYPLTCDLCRACGHVQTSCVTNPQDRYFRLHDYSYTSSNSSFARNHWQEYADDLRRAGLQTKSFVIEIGSNDGFLASQFLGMGHRVLGIDASNYMARLARKRKIETVVALFDKNVATVIRRKYGRARLLVANNVFNHADSPADFLWGVSALMEKDGMFVFEQPYWLSSIKGGKLDQIYHEHVSYFTVKSARKLLQRIGLSIANVEEVNYHGGSLRVYATKGAATPSARKTVTMMIRREEEAGLFDPAKYREVMAAAQSRRNAFLQRFYKLKQQGYSVIAVGAPAKGNTLLNYYRLDKTVVDFVTDASPHKQGKFTPLTRIPIVGDAVFKRFNKVCALVLSWNIVDIIKPKLLKINKGIRFISPERED